MFPLFFVHFPHQIPIVRHNGFQNNVAVNFKAFLWRPVMYPEKIHSKYPESTREWSNFSRSQNRRISIKTYIRSHVLYKSKLSVFLRQDTIISDQELNLTSYTRNKIYLFQEYTPNFQKLTLILQQGIDRDMNGLIDISYLQNMKYEFSQIF